MTRKEQKEEKRKRILMTALDLFVRKGYYDTKISDIAEAVPMSVGLLFHYFESKEVLLRELVKMGAEGTKSAVMPGAGAPAEGAPSAMPPDLTADVYLLKFLEKMFAYAKEQPWVFNMFVLMGQARRTGMPEEARKEAATVDTIGSTVMLIEKGQREGVFHEGDPATMSACFWASVQGIMEEMALNPEMKAPEPGWLLGILKR